MAYVYIGRYNIDSFIKIAFIYEGLKGQNLKKQESSYINKHKMQIIS